RPHFEEANVVFDVDTGKRARFEEPVITGDPGRSQQSLIRSTHWKRLYGLLGWQEVTEARVRQGMDNVRRYYEKRNMLDSRVTLAGLEYYQKTNTVQPTIDVQTGIRVTIRAVGAKISPGKLKELVPVFQEHSMDADLLVEGQHNIEQYLVSQGYFGTEVTYDTAPEQNANERIITYQIKLGERHKFVHLGITGNKYFSLETIRERLYLQPAEFPRFPYGRYSELYVKQDVQSIENLYRSNGFREAKVTSKTEDDYRGVKNRLAVFIELQEGPQWFVSGLSIDGASEDDLT